jgi:hypothetical protein
MTIPSHGPQLLACILCISQTCCATSPFVRVGGRSVLCLRLPSGRIFATASFSIGRQSWRILNPEPIVIRFNRDLCLNSTWPTFLIPPSLNFHSTFAIVWVCFAHDFFCFYLLSLRCDSCKYFCLPSAYLSLHWLFSYLSL